MPCCTPRSALTFAACAVLLSGCNLQKPPASNAAASNPAANPRPGQPAVQVPDPAADLYGETGGEEVFPADKARPGSPLRARKGDTFFKLSNAKVEPIGKRPFPSLVVDYEKLTEGPFNGVSLVVQRADGRSETYLLIRPFYDRKGEIRIDLGIAPPGQPGPPKNAEVYFTRSEPRYGGGFNPTFKVSNSAVIGKMKELTLPRAWTAEEAAKLRQPPPEGPKANVNPSVGEDTEFAGGSDGGNFRYAEAGKPVLGVEYWTGEWDKEPCLAQLIPVYEAKQPVEGAAQRVMARPGYAMGGLTVKTKRYVNAVQVTFMKLKPDGKLDPKDRYTSKWLGADQVEGKEVKLGGDGRTVIGLNCRKGAILNAVALVMENAK